MKPALVVRNAMRSGYLPEMARKVYLRMRYGAREAAAGGDWAAGNVTDMHAWATAIDPELWAEALKFANAMRADCEPMIADLREAGLDMGGGGCYELLYFLVRSRRPTAVLETGVAAGWSTRALLSALARNESGHLWSSDFPYFRHPDPERLIGCLVPPELGSRWTLRTKGDRKNLVEFLCEDRYFDLVHYDSDKTRGGREMFIKRVRGNLAADCALVMDDIQDDLYFRDLVSQGLRYSVFAFEGKYLGLIEGVGRASSAAASGATQTRSTRSTRSA